MRKAIRNVTHLILAFIAINERKGFQFYRRICGRNEICKKQLLIVIVQSQLILFQKQHILLAINVFALSTDSFIRNKRRICEQRICKKFIGKSKMGLLTECQDWILRWDIVQNQDIALKKTKELC